MCVYIKVYVYIDDIVSYVHGQVTWEEMRVRREKKKNDGFDEVLGDLITGGNWGKRL